MRCSDSTDCCFEENPLGRFGRATTGRVATSAHFHHVLVKNSTIESPNEFCHNAKGDAASAG
jgi:hypothetical protein